MRPENLKTQIFLDSGDSDEARQAIEMLGFLDGQTTNPSLIVRNPAIQSKLLKGEKFSKDEVYGMYKSIVQEISSIIPKGSISVEVYVDLNTRADEIVKQAKELNTWIKNTHIKLPVTVEGLKAVEILAEEEIKLNITLVFSQEQAAAVYSATKDAKKGQIYLSPFVGRLDDRGENGMDLIKNIIQMYKKGDGHVEVLSASVRSYNHLLYSIFLGADIVTAPFKILKEWRDNGMELPDENYVYECPHLKPIPFEKVDLNKKWQDYNIKHELTDRGVEKFCADWNNLLIT